jgi:hypothetical protein
MVNRSKNIGTAGETAVVKAVRTRGFPGAERRALHGSTDLGDILLCPGAIVEVKAGNAAKTASDNQIEDWLGETIIEMTNADADVALLVVARKAIGAQNAHRWWAWVLLSQQNEILDGGEMLVAWSPRFYLEDALEVVRHYGWGDPL